MKLAFSGVFLSITAQCAFSAFRHYRHNAPDCICPTPSTELPVSTLVDPDEAKCGKNWANVNECDILRYLGEMTRSDGLLRKSIFRVMLDQLEVSDLQ